MNDGMRDLFDVCAARHGGNAQSVAANARKQPTKAEQREKVYERIRDAGRNGMTCDEIAVAMVTTPNALSGRCTELKRAKRIEKRGTRPTRSGSPAAVYIVPFANNTASFCCGGSA